VLCLLLQQVAVPVRRDVRRAVVLHVGHLRFLGNPGSVPHSALDSDVSPLYRRVFVFAGAYFSLRAAATCCLNYQIVRVPQALSTPVYCFEFDVYQVEYKYMSSSISVASEIGVGESSRSLALRWIGYTDDCSLVSVALGPLSDIIIFFAFASAAKGFYKVSTATLNWCFDC
jgi:hypothetical protein